MKKFLKKLEHLGKKRSPEICMIAGIGGMITTTITAVRATPKALAIINELEKNSKKDEPITKKEKIKATWKCYIPSAIIGAASICCIIGGDSIHVKRNAALATICKITETAFTDYKTATENVVGVDKIKEIKETIGKEKVKNNPPKTNTVIVTGSGTNLYYDQVFGQYFEADFNRIEKARNEVNNKIINNDYATLNDFYEELGVGLISIGNEIGWNISDGLLEITKNVEIKDTGQACIVISYEPMPAYGYSEYN